MGTWKVELARIELFPHPNAEKLELAKVGEHQYVVQKGIYRNGVYVISVPEKSLLPDNLAEEFRQYLRGANRNIVGITKIRGEISEGILLDPAKWLISPVSDTADLAEHLGITKYEAPIPPALAGDVKGMEFQGFTSHDCSPYSILADSTFSLGEEIVVCEKIHGSQMNVLMTLQNGEITSLEVTSKGLGKSGTVLKEPQNNSNFYWRALRNTDLVSLTQKHFYKGANPVQVQIVGEGVPVQKGYTYGFTKPTILVYRVVVDGKTLPLYNVPDYFTDYWVPMLWRGMYDEHTGSWISSLAQGKSSLAEHIKEGVVVSSVSNPSTYLKFISDSYAKKNTGEEFN